MSGELKGEWKLLKVWECHKCKELIKDGRRVSEHKCEIRENDLVISNKTIEEQKKIIDDQKTDLENQRKVIDEQKTTIENQKNAIGSHKATIKDQKKTIEDQNKTIEYYKKTIESQNMVIDEKNKFIKEKIAEDQYKIIEDQKKTIEGHKRAIDSQRRSIEERDMTIDEQKKIIDNQKKIIREKELDEKTINKNIPKIDNKENNGVYVHIWNHGKTIKDSKDTGYREDMEIDIFAKGRGRDRIIIKNGKVVKKPEDIEIIGTNSPTGFIVQGMYKI